MRTGGDAGRDPHWYVKGRVAAYKIPLIQQVGLCHHGHPVCAESKSVTVGVGMGVGDPLAAYALSVSELSFSFAKLVKSIIGGFRLGSISSEP